jgi:alpha-beta hydrolase superfamily lysophospholipase
VSETRRIEVAPGTELFTEIWEPESDPKFVVLVVHGQGEYVSRYDEVARDINAAGGLVFGADLRGQGRSTGPMGYIERFEDYASDLMALCQTIAAERPETQRPDALPWFVYGHSMGGLVSLIFTLEFAQALPIRGVIVSNPWIEPAARGATVKKLLGKVLVRFAPKLQIPINLDRSLLFRDEERLKVYMTDRTGFDPLTPRFGEAVAAAVQRVRDEAAHIEVPMLWMVGTGDRIMHPQPTIDLFRGIPGTEGRDQHLEIFDGYYHELHNEPPAERQRVMDLVIKWIGERI